MSIVTRTQALKKLYKAVVGEDTTKNDPTKIISELADNWPEGGGGGSSDFSTALMTISGFPSGIDGGVSIGGFVEIDDDTLMPVSNSSNYQNGAYVVVLYQGTGHVDCYDSITVSGDAEYDGEGMITATGDFTIAPIN